MRHDTRYPHPSTSRRPTKRMGAVFAASGRHRHMSRFTALLLLFAFIAPLTPHAHVASESRRPDLSREQIVARIKRAESQLANGRPSVAIQTIWRVIEEFAGFDRTMSFIDGVELYAHARQPRALASVRISTTDSYFKNKDRAQELAY